ncbi:hypothetical protein [Acidianus ambivalens]|uniref:hypothetical protein n=1 Tax=Acidianus ambivalens TaxID=2283 RepID=UPI00128EE1DF|nr:hypothetical protein [Acidianus ambivalens]
MKRVNKSLLYFVYTIKVTKSFRSEIRKKLNIKAGDLIHVILRDRTLSLEFVYVLTL